MAGTVPFLPLGMMFDKDTGAQLKNGKLYVFAADTDSPQNAYKDTGLTLVHPNPIPLDGAGRIPNFYLADGYIRVRLESSTGIVQFDERIVLVIGPSSGAGTPVTVDPEKQFETGDVYWRPKSGTRSGWVRLNGRTIGSATSGASERANADCQPLFLDLWNGFSDAVCPVITGRGGSAAADWAANKQITLPDMAGVSAIGLDDLGAGAKTRFTGVPIIVGAGVTTPGATVGENAHALITAEHAAHTHPSPAVNDLGHVHNAAGTDSATPNSGNLTEVGNGPGVTTASATTGITLDATTGSSGSGTAHNTVQRSALGTWLMKL